MSPSFHGRDIFAAVAAHLAAGITLARVGKPLDPSELVGLNLPSPQVTDSGLTAHVLHSDHFGNIMLDAEGHHRAASGLRPGTAVTVNGVHAAHATTFTDVPPGTLLLYEDAYGVVSLAINRGSPLEALELEVYARVQNARDA